MLGWKASLDSSMANLGGDENERLSTLKRGQLGVYLRDRGIPFSTRNKDDRLTLAKNAEKKLLPLKTTIESDQITVLEERKQRLVLEDRLIKLPDPDKILVGWERVYNKFPNATRAEVDDYLKFCKFRIYREYFT